MAFDRLAFGKVWTSEADFPTYQDSEEQVRADLQYHPNAIRDFINKLLTALENKTAAGNIGALKDGVSSNVQSVLDSHADEMERLAEDIRIVAGGGAPSVVKSSTVAFTTDSWATVGGKTTLTIPQSDHGRDSASFGYNIYQLVDGVYRSGTWGVVATRVTYNSSNIVLTTDEAYSGKIVFFGM